MDTGFSYIAGDVAIDLVNTVSWRGLEPARERLTSYGDWIAWGLHAGVLSELEARRLLRAAGAEPERAAEALEQARELREAIYQVAAAFADGHHPQAAAVAGLGRALGRARRGERLVHAGDRLEWRPAEADALDAPLAPVARAAERLLTSAAVLGLRRCAAVDCGWLFLDTSRNHRRRWCSMSECGNREKARRHYQRRRSES